MILFSSAEIIRRESRGGGVGVVRVIPPPARTPLRTAASVIKSAFSGRLTLSALSHAKAFKAGRRYCVTDTLSLMD